VSRSRRGVWLIGPVVLAGAIASCDPCAGTPSCEVPPEVSASGSFIERPSGRAVSGVQVAFIRRQGAPLRSDTMRSVSDRDGFFLLREAAYEAGGVVGDLVVTPSPPGTPYTVRGIELRATGRRGDGAVLGRLFVNPWLQFIGELHDRKTDAQVPGATVTVRSLGPGLVTPLVTTTVAAENGRFSWEPSIDLFDALIVEWEVAADNYPRAYRFRDTILPQFRDEPPRFIVLKVGGGWSYAGHAYRRGTNTFLPGVAVEWVRTGGIMTSPPSFTATPNANGTFPVPIEPVGDGVAVGRLTIRPPAPLPEEVIEGVELATFDGGKTRLFGPFGYGPATIARPVILYRATGKPVPVGTWVRFRHVGGLSPIFPAAWTVPDSGIRIVDSTGTVAYDAATLEAGTVQYELQVRLNAPHDWDTLTVSIPARFSSAPECSP
jgi:hypothetical protein